MTKEMEILIQYHREQVDEAIASNEFDQARLHDYLLGIAQRALASIGRTEENPA